MQTSLSVRILVLLSLCKCDIAVAYPTTISEGYRTCITCHTTASGGTLINKYGRSVASDALATFQGITSARDFLRGGSFNFNWGSNYRHLALYKEKTDPVNFPMVADIDGAVSFGPLTIANSIGVYSREKDLESRESYAQLKIARSTSARVGYFMPHIGIGSNDHSLYISRLLGLSRGNESYNVELWHMHEWFQVFYTASVKEFTLRNGELNLYELTVPYGSEVHRLRLSLLAIKKWEIGLNYLTSLNYKASGFFVKGSILKHQYLFYERDTNDDEVASYFRVGMFVFKGIDWFYEFEQSETDFGTLRNHGPGFEWMLFPGFEFGIKVNLGDGFSQGQTHLWL